MKSKAVTNEAVRLWHEGTLALSRMEANGVRIDEPYVKEQIEKVGLQIKEYGKSLKSDKVWKEWQRKFQEKANLGSRQQMAAVIFDGMGYERRTTGTKKQHDADGEDRRRESKYSEAVFGGVDLPFVRDYFLMQKLMKLKSTYLEGILREAVNGIVHPVYNLHKVITFRSSCEAPNWQNCVKRNKKIAEMLRRCYIPRKGRHFVEPDYGTLEVRVACCYTKDGRLIKDFTQGGDAHGDTARSMFFLKDGHVTGENRPREFKAGMRDWVKNRWVFPQFFGSVHFQCAPHIWEAVESGALMPGEEKLTVKKHLRRNGIKGLGDCTPGADTEPGTFVHHLKQIEDDFWNKRFKVYSDWKRKRWDEYLSEGKFSMFTGFVCEGLFKKNDVLNYPIQGAAFHLNLEAIIMIQKALDRYKMKSLLVGEIHDCNDADVPTQELQDYTDLAYDVMTRRVPKKHPWVIVPMEVSVEVSDRDAPWSQLKDWDKRSGQWAEVPKG